MTTTWTSDKVFEEILLPLVGEIEEEVGEEIAKDRATTLLGEESALDSLAVVTFLVSVEEQLEQEAGREIKLVDERAMSRRASPFRTLGTLADHISELL
jgi:acyl carrier protein